MTWNRAVNWLCVLAVVAWVLLNAYTTGGSSDRVAYPDYPDLCVNPTDGACIP